MENKKQFYEYTVFILSAGLGTRLRPLTNNTPKVMLPIAEGVPMLQHSIEWMRDQGFKHFVINLHYLGNQIVEYFGDGKKIGVRIDYSQEDRLLDLAGGIKKAEHLLSDDFILLYGDNVHFFEFALLISMHV